MKITTAHSPKMTENGGVELIVDFEGIGAIPFHATADDPEPHGREIHARAIAGEFGPVMPYVAPEVVPPTEAEILAEMKAAIQGFLDAKPKEREYDGILSLCTYATSTDPKFQAEGQAGVAWRDAVWAKAYDVMAAVRAGERAVPAVDELLAELPAFHWPDEVEP